MNRPKVRVGIPSSDFLRRRSAAVAFAAVEAGEDDFVVKRNAVGGGSGAAAFGVAGVGSGGEREAPCSGRLSRSRRWCGWRFGH